MSDLRKAAEMALNALDMYREHDAKNIGLADAAYEALRQALAHPEQEPVGYVTIENISSWAQVPSIKWFKKPTQGPLYTAPPKREWVGLTEVDIYEAMDFDDEFDFAKAIEAKLKEKNT